MHAARGDERLLRRVIALLAAFAVLAERAAGRPLAVRWFVLWILRRAETAAAAFVFEEVGLPLAILEGREGIAAVGNDPADARRLAVRFRALAAALCSLLPDRHRLGRPARRGYTFGSLAPRSSGSLSCLTREPYDTS